MNKIKKISGNLKTIYTNTSAKSPSDRDIICASTTPYLPEAYLGKTIERCLEKMDYMVSLTTFSTVLSKLKSKEKINERLPYESNNVYEVLTKDILTCIKELDNVDNIGKFTNKEFDVYAIKYLQDYSQDLLEDINGNILHKFIELERQKSNLIIHLHPYKCMKYKGFHYNKAVSYCICIMWATILGIVVALGLMRFQPQRM